MSASTVPPPSAETQLELIKPELERALVVGDAWCLVHIKWLERWKYAVGMGSYGLSATESELAQRVAGLTPIRNDDLVEATTGKMRRGLAQDLDFSLVSEVGYDLLASWYGGGPKLVRYAISAGHSFARSTVLELYLLRVRLIETLDSEAETLLEISRKLLVGDLIDLVAKTFNIEDQSRMRLIDAMSRQRGELLDDREMTLERAAISQDQHILLERKNDAGAWPKPPTPPPKNTTSTRTVDDADSDEDWRQGAPLRPLTSSSSYGMGYGMGYGMSSYYSDKRTGGTPGVCGLTNLGNTCFMNSGLQCIAHTPNLVEYLLASHHESELNRTNPLGMGGEVAEAFVTLLREMWGGYGTTAPRDFKYTIGRFAPRFVGFGQQDSQELVAFLLDGLHEDLNRCVTKPLVPVLESDGRPDAEVAAEAWQGHLKRHNSAIVDLFQGQFKSRLECPECGKISVTFDPFMYLTVPLPEGGPRELNIKFIPVDGTRKPILCQVIVPATAVLSDLKVAVAALVQLPPDQLVVMELYDSHMYKLFDDSESVASINDNETIVAYELPPPPPEGVTRALFPLYHATMVTKSYGMTHYMREENFGLPLLIALNLPASYANLESALYDRMQRYVTRPSEESLAAAKAARATKLAAREAARAQAKAAKAAERAAKKAVRDAKRAKHAAQVEALLAQAETKATTQATPEEGEAGEETSAPAADEGAESSSVSSTTTESSSSRGAASDSDVAEGDETALQPVFKIQAPHRCGHSIDEILAGTFVPRADDEYKVLWASASAERQYDRAVADEHSVVTQPPMAPAEDTSPNVYRCLDAFRQEEQLGEKDMWHCPQCREMRRARKKLDLFKLPEVLVIHLKRFRQYGTFSREKVDTFVDYPLEGLDLTPYVLGPQDSPPIYDLYAISDHFGGLGGGHYTAHAKNHRDGQWYYFNDSSTSVVHDTKDVISAAAYLLFYQRRGAAPLAVPPGHGQATAGPGEAADVAAVGPDVEPATPKSESDGFIESTADVGMV